MRAKSSKQRCPALNKMYVIGCFVKGSNLIRNHFSDDLDSEADSAYGVMPSIYKHQISKLAMIHA